MKTTITGADLVRLDEQTDVREVVEADLGDEELDELTRQLEDGTAEFLFGRLCGWGRERTLRDSGGSYYHVDVSD